MGHRLSVKLVMLHAAGSAQSNQFNGYYTWPRLGFNADVSDVPGLAEALEKAGFHGVMDTNELFRREGGADWWKQNGSGIFCFFDLQNDSESFENLRVYLYQKGVVAHD